MSEMIKKIIENNPEMDYDEIAEQIADVTDSGRLDMRGAIEQIEATERDMSKETIPTIETTGSTYEIDDRGNVTLGADLNSPESVTDASKQDDKGSIETDDSNLQ